ncbi:endoplasmic reticulum junction formation protein lunapark-B-like isoform X2 [Convolutriloba macropyga]|uniref:endoplasmic reticulum junction formation protein lunapark-B-like isoform X2 n=1 Tax=Convolutriloba macropyga TaxID=536237 RepID=UPI003F52164B
MGSFFSLFQRRSLSEQLEEVENSINAVRKNRYQSQQRQKRLVASVTLWSLLLYTLIAASFLAFYFPPSWKLRILYALPLCFGPFLAYLLRRIVMMYFSTRLKSSDETLRGLVEKKKTLLDAVREKESYKKGKEILEKYDPEVIKMKNMAEELQRLRSQSANSEVRKRQLPANASPNANLTATPMQSMPRGAAGQFATPQQPNMSAMMQRVPNTAPGSPMMTPQRLPELGVHDEMFARPIPPPASARSRSAAGKSTFDRMMEYIVGDGPENKYALICSHCLNHNGMALKEEFEYVAFRCAYCGMSNPAKKGRPVAPKVPISVLPPTPSPQLQQPKQQSVSTSSSASATSQNANQIATTSSTGESEKEDDGDRTPVTGGESDEESSKNAKVSKSNAGQDEKSENAETSGLETDDNDCNESVDKTLDNSLEPMETSITDNGPNGVKDAIREDRKEMGSDEGDESLIADMEILNKEDLDTRETEDGDNNKLQSSVETGSNVDVSDSGIFGSDLPKEEGSSSEGSVDSIALNGANLNPPGSTNLGQKAISAESSLPDLLQ